MQCIDGTTGATRKQKEILEREDGGPGLTDTNWERGNTGESTGKG